MTEAERLHRQAMELTDDALAAQLAGQAVESRELFRRAYQLERKAAESMSDNLEPTRSILYRSAATLALDCHLPAEAKGLVLAALKHDPPREIKDELWELFEKAERVAAVSFDLKLVDAFKNRSLYPDREFILLATVAAPETQSSGVVVAFHQTRDALFVYDSGADFTLISGGLAAQLMLPHYDSPVLVNAVEGTLKVVMSRFRIKLGGSLIEIPCVIPWPVLRYDKRPNLLGRCGLGEKFGFYCNASWLRVYEDASRPESELQSEW